MREICRVGHGLHEYTTCWGDSVLKIANCVELQTMSEFDDVTLTFCCSDRSGLPIIKKSDPGDASCEMLEFCAENAGPGCTHGTGLNPVGASTQATLKDTVPAELKEQPSIAM